MTNPISFNNRNANFISEQKMNVPIDFDKEILSQYTGFISNNIADAIEPTYADSSINIWFKSNLQDQNKPIVLHGLESFCKENSIVDLEQITFMLNNNDVGVVAYETKENETPIFYVPPGEREQFGLHGLEIHELSDNGEITVAQIDLHHIEIREFTPAQYARISLIAQRAFNDINQSYAEQSENSKDLATDGPKISILEKESKLHEIIQNQFEINSENRLKDRQKAKRKDEQREEEKSWEMDTQRKERRKKKDAKFISEKKDQQQNTEIKESIKKTEHNICFKILFSERFE